VGGERGREGERGVCYYTFENLELNSVVDSALNAGVPHFT
jgi:hypothetical protein